MIFTTQEKLIEDWKAFLKSKSTFRKIAENLDLNPQDLTKIFNKRHFTFTECALLLKAINHSLFIDFVDDSIGEEYIKLNENQKQVLRTYEALSDIGKAEFRGMLKGMLK